jgi:hypothetical protein
MAQVVTPAPQSPIECAMSGKNSQPVVLAAHPSTPNDALRSLQVRVSIREGEALVLDYSLQGDLSRLRIPARRTPQRAGELWKHTCFEAFVVTDDSPGYYELNFSPSGEWAAYRFSAYRTGMVPADGIGVPTTHVEVSGQGLEMQAAIAIEAIRHAMQPPKTLRIALAAVIEARNGKLSYWAHHHPPGKPDFHHRDAFFEISS